MVVLLRWLPRWTRASNREVELRWVRLVQKLFSLKYLQRVFHLTGSYLKSFPRPLLDSLSNNLTRWH